MPERITLRDERHRPVEFIRADALRTKLGGYHDSDLLSLAESLRTFHDNAEATMEKMQAQLAERDAKIAELETDRSISVNVAEDFYALCQQWQDENAAIRARIAELEAMQRWISVDERLPEPLVSVLVWTDDSSFDNSDNFDLGFHQKDHGWLLAMEWEHGDPTVTHWMPLPPPPIAPVEHEC